MPAKSKIARVYDGPPESDPQRFKRESYEKELRRSFAEAVIKAIKEDEALLHELYQLLKAYEYEV